MYAQCVRVLILLFAVYSLLLSSDTHFAGVLAYYLFTFLVAVADAAVVVCLCVRNVFSLSFSSLALNGCPTLFPMCGGNRVCLCIYAKHFCTFDLIYLRLQFFCCCCRIPIMFMDFKCAISLVKSNFYK